jgi:hypothetical protein
MSTEATRRREEGDYGEVAFDEAACIAHDRPSSRRWNTSFAALGRRVALYRGCHAEDHSIGAARDLALVARRAMVEEFQVGEA